MLDRSADWSKQWGKQFHTWAMEWNSSTITVTLDGSVTNTQQIAAADTAGKINPWHKPFFMRLNLAIGGPNGGDPSGSAFPMMFEIDYVRVYQKKSE